MGPGCKCRRLQNTICCAKYWRDLAQTRMSSCPKYDFNMVPVPPIGVQSSNEFSSLSNSALPWQSTRLTIIIYLIYENVFICIGTRSNTEKNGLGSSWTSTI
jgi:hypothetical protein